MVKVTDRREIKANHELNIGNRKPNCFFIINLNTNNEINKKKKKKKLTR